MRNSFIKPRAPGLLFSLALGVGACPAGGHRALGRGSGKIHAWVERGGVPWFSRQDFLFPLLCTFCLPRGGDGTSHPPRIPAPPPLRSCGTAAILARQVAGKSQTLALGARKGRPSCCRQRDLPGALLLSAWQRGFEACGGRPGSCQARGGGAGGAAAASPGRTLPPGREERDW